ERRTRLGHGEEVEQHAHVACDRARKAVPIRAAVQSPVVVEPLLDVERERVRDGHAERRAYVIESQYETCRPPTKPLNLGDREARAQLLRRRRHRWWTCGID